MNDPVQTVTFLSRQPIVLEPGPIVQASAALILRQKRGS